MFGAHAVETILAEASIGDDIKCELQAARRYAEGTGFRLDVRDESRLRDIQRLIEIKLA